MKIEKKTVATTTTIITTTSLALTAHSCIMFLAGGIVAVALPPVIRL